MANRPTTTSEKLSFISLAFTAALSALLVVSVYEIRARFSTGRHALPAPATHSDRDDATEAGGARPRPLSGESCDSLKSRYILQCATNNELPMGGSAVASGGSSAAISAEQEAQEIAAAAKWAHPPKSELTDMASRCELRFISPSVTESQVPTVDDESARALSLSTNERAELDQTLRQMHQNFVDSVRQAYDDGAGNSGKASTLSLDEMMSEIQDRPNSGFEQAQRKLALERAGLALPPAANADLPPGERIFRLSAGLGDDFERRLAERVGADRARQLRFSPNAGPWTNHSARSGCP